MAQRYPYLPLHQAERQIRLLTLFPGEFSSIAEDASPIEVEFQTISFASGPIPKYEALSYVWGVERSPDPVMVKSPSLERSFVEVTQNLATALVYLRYRTEPRVLWIDALCINQEDVEERSSQVARMASIYRLADRVVVWLGPENEERGSTEALSTLRYIGSQIEVDWNTLQMRASDQGDPSWADRDIPLGLDQKCLDPILMLFNRSWFERVWVQQEIALANDNAVLVCGHDSIMRRQFANAVFCLQVKARELDWDQSTLFSDRLDLAFSMALSIYVPEKLSYAETLRDQARNLKCSDPRDRIFAVLSISSFRDGGGSIEVDYSKTTEEVYRQFTAKQILHTNNLELLTACEAESNQESLHNPMPSWVPDWRRPVVSRRLKQLFASGRSVAAAQFGCKEETLTLTGVKCATVTQFQPTFIHLYPHGWHRNDIADGIQRCIQFWGLSEEYVTGGNAHDAYLRTLCGDYFSHRFHPSNFNAPDFESSSSALTRFLEKRFVDENNNFISLSHTYRFANRVLAVCQGRSCFTTTEGYIGIAPAETKTGDIICVLLGGNVPIVLRPNGEEKFSVVGECYCHGIMDGDALLGPLPEGFEFAWTFDQIQGVSFPSYIGRHEKKVQGEDPRLSRHPLPHRWRIDMCNEDGTHINFVEENDDGTEKTRTAHFDPRMTPEELRKRGTDLVKFNLK